MSNFSRMLVGMLAGIMIWGCAPKQGQIERPDWAKDPVSWEYAGLYVSDYGKAEFSTDAVESSRQAEEDAMQHARETIARQIAKAYLKASGDSRSEDAAAREIQNYLGNLIERRSHYDEQRQVYFIQIFVPSSKIERILNEAFKSNLKVQTNGQLGS